MIYALGIKGSVVVGLAVSWAKEDQCRIEVGECGRYGP